MATNKKLTRKNRNIIIAIILAVVAILLVTGLIIFNIAKPKETKTTTNKFETTNIESSPADLTDKDKPPVPPPPIFETPPVKK